MASEGIRDWSYEKCTDQEAEYCLDDPATICEAHARSLPTAGGCSDPGSISGLTPTARLRTGGL
jgi:hypothetical protein